MLLDTPLWLSLSAFVAAEHPGLVLRQAMESAGMSPPADLAPALRMPVTHVIALTLGERPVTAETALRLERYFGLPAAA